jgi:hypothetical protein
LALLGNNKGAVHLMVNLLQWLFGILIIVTCVLSASYSFRSRRANDGLLRGLHTSKMNISMGLMLIFIAIIQMFLFSGSSLRVVIGALFFLLGLFNLFAGLRNYSQFTRLLKKTGNTA